MEASSQPISSSISGPSGVIRAIDRNTVHRICAGQVVVDLATAVKELVENSLDAEATVIEVKLKEMGAESIEVTDNGSGIRKGDHEGVAKKHFTSKIEDFSDLNSVKSFGFRGEAINALNELSKVLVVTTKRDDDQIGSQLTFERDGSLKQCKPIARGGKGTTVLVEKLFDSLPVRRNEFVRNIKKQYAKLLKVLQSYAVVSTGVKFSIVNITKDSKQVVLATQCSNSMGDNISSVFGSKFLNTLTKVNIDCNAFFLKSQSEISSSNNKSNSSENENIDITSSAMDIVGDEDFGDDNNDVEEKEYQRKTAIEGTDVAEGMYNNNDDDNNNNDNAVVEEEGAKYCNNNSGSSKSTAVKFICETSVSGYISKAGSGVGRSDNDRQFIFVNGRPVDLPRITKILNEVWRRYEMKHKPAFIVNISVPSGSFDVNLTPDKREVVLVHEKLIVDILRDAIDEIYTPSRYTFAVSSQPKFSFGKSQSISQPFSDSTKIAATGDTATGDDIDEAIVDNHEDEICENSDERHISMSVDDDNMLQNKSQQPEPALNRIVTSQQDALAEYDRLFNDEIEENDKNETFGNRSNDFVIVSNSLALSSDKENVHSHQEMSLDWSEEERPPLAFEGKRRSSRNINKNNSISDEWDETIIANRSTLNTSNNSNNNCSSKERSVSGGKRTYVEVIDEEDSSGDKEVNSPGAVMWSTKNQTKLLNSSQGTWSPHNSSTKVKSNSSRDVSNTMSSSSSSRSSSNLRDDKPIKHPQSRSARTSQRLIDLDADGSDDDESDIDYDDDDDNNKSVSVEDGDDEVDNPNQGGDEVNTKNKSDDEVVFVRNSSRKNIKAGIIDVQTTNFSGFLEENMRIDSNFTEKPPATSVTSFSSSEGKGNSTFNSLVHSDATWHFNPEHVLSDYKSKIEEKRLKKKKLDESSLENNKENMPYSTSSEDLLSRLINKQDFLTMKVLGQFNLGFMICELKGDIYILDQHACDEKFRFETLQQTTTIHQQPLISPLTVETNAAEEIVIIENMKIFEANGFKLRLDEHEPPGNRIKLLSVPFSKSVQFNTDDVHELASLLSDESSSYVTKLILKNDINPNFANSKNDKNLIRLPKLATMFASRACRSAVMIGTALNNNEMRGIVDRLATIDQPWNCPHGRPTMRHLFDLSSYVNDVKGKDKDM